MDASTTSGGRLTRNGVVRVLFCVLGRRPPIQFVYVEVLFFEVRPIFLYFFNSIRRKGAFIVL